MRHAVWLCAMVESVGSLIEKSRDHMGFYYGWCNAHGEFKVLMPTERYRNIMPLCPYCYREHINQYGLKFNSRGEKTHDIYGNPVKHDESKPAEGALKFKRSATLQSLQRSYHEKNKSKKTKIWEGFEKCEA